MNPLLISLYDSIRSRIPSDSPKLNSFDWDAAGVRNRYLICMTPRSGSTWLSSLLSSTGIAGRPAEFFNEDMIPFYNRDIRAKTFSEYFSRIVVGFTVGSTFGLKINFYRMRFLEELIDFKAVFLTPGTQLVTLFRRDYLSQAISLSLAFETGVWHRLADGSQLGPGGSLRKEPPVSVDNLEDEAVWDWMVNLVLEEQRWEQFFDRYELYPMRLTYEDLVVGSKNQVLRILKYLMRESACPNLVDRVDALTNSTQRLGADVSWKTSARMRMRYANEIEQLGRLRSLLELERFAHKLRASHGISVELRH